MQARNAVYIVEYNHYNIMNLVFHIDHGYLAADTMGLLLKNGGDPNLAVEIETIYALDALEVRTVTKLWEDPNNCESASASSLEKEMELLLFDM